MLDVEAVILGELERLSPLPTGAVSDWRDVLSRANAVAQPHRVLAKPRLQERRQHTLWPLARRPLVVALALLAAVLIPLIALGAANEWWFFKSGHAPTPTSTPVVVKQGVWDGHAWELDAYRSTTDGLCFAVKARGSILGAAMGCLPFVGVARTDTTKHTTPLTITYMSRAGDQQFPAYIAGPVVGNASEVEIRFADGKTVRVPTFAAPHSLGRVRFYATPLPAHEFLPKWAAGLDDNGHVIACILGVAGGGPAPPSACK